MARVQKSVQRCQDRDSYCWHRDGAGLCVKHLSRQLAAKNYPPGQAPGWNIPKQSDVAAHTEKKLGPPGILGTPEIVAPGGHTVRFINHDSCELLPLVQAVELVHNACACLQLLGSRVQELDCRRVLLQLSEDCSPFLHSTTGFWRS